MTILAQIHPPDTTRAILDCLGLASRAPPRAPARAALRRLRPAPATGRSPFPGRPAATRSASESAA